MLKCWLQAFAVLLCMAAASARAQPVADSAAAPAAPPAAAPLVGPAPADPAVALRAQEELVRHGFENVRAVSEDGHLVVTYENRLYRYEVRALREAVRLVAPIAPGEGRLTLVPQRAGLPLVAVTVPVEAYRAFERGELSDEAFVAAMDFTLGVEEAWGKVRSAAGRNASFFRFDVVVHPQLQTQFGEYGNPVESQVSLAPALASSWWRGMRLFAQVVLPVQNDLNDEDYVRPGLVTVSQSLRLPAQSFASMTLGYFSRHRYGANLSVKKYLWDGRVAVGGTAGYTGFASFRGGEWLYSDPDLLTSSASLEYRLPRYTLGLRAAYGKFVFGDVGWRMDVVREFGEVRLGLFGLATEAGRNAGFHVSVPLLVRKHSRPARARVRLAERFAWEYAYRGLSRAGKEYSAGEEIDPAAEGLLPPFAKHHLLEETRR